MRLFLAPHDPDPDQPGHWRARGGSTGIPEDLDWDSLDRVCPVVPLPDPYRSLLSPEVADGLRAELRNGLVPPFHDHVAIRFGECLRDAICTQCPELASGAQGRLYALEFQGPCQYVMLGRTTSVRKRVSRHLLDAGHHGYGLLNAWVSPVLPHAGQQERMALDLAGDLHCPNVAAAPSRGRFFVFVAQATAVDQ